jgi:two-component system response regulator
MKTILLVEDNPDDVALTLHAIRQQHLPLEVVVAADGVQALDYLAACAPGELPWLVLLDLKLPRLGGLGVLAQIRADQRTHLLPVVVLTSSKEDRDLVGSYELGANSYVRKPVDYDAFREAVGRLGLYWLLVNEPPPAVPGGEP